MGYKRRRMDGGGYQAKRPIDKKLLVVNKANVVGSNQSLDLLAPTSPCTVCGIRWSLMAGPNGGTSGNQHDFQWAIVLLPDGNTVDNPATVDGQIMYQPEQHVLAFGSSSSDGTAFVSQEGQHFEGTSKSMRKLKEGDKVVFVCRGVATEPSRIFGTVQVFCKA